MPTHSCSHSHISFWLIELERVNVQGAAGRPSFCAFLRCACLGRGQRPAWCPGVSRGWGCPAVWMTPARAKTVGHSGPLGALLLLCCEPCPYLAKCSHLTLLWRKPLRVQQTAQASPHHHLREQHPMGADSSCQPLPKDLFPFC